MDTIYSQHRLNDSYTVKFPDGSVISSSTFTRALRFAMATPHTVEIRKGQLNVEADFSDYKLLAIVTDEFRASVKEFSKINSNNTCIS